MKTGFFTDCGAILDAIYDVDGDRPLSITDQFKIKAHLFFCDTCNLEYRNLQCIQEIMKDDFFPPSPQPEESFLDHLYTEPDIQEKSDISAGFSLKSWVITGFFVLFSLLSSFFGINFTQIAASEGSSFLLPVGITIGMVLTCYGAFFIGSHLKELSDRFGLH